MLPISRTGQINMKLRHIKFSSFIDSFSKRLFFGTINERFKKQIFSFNDEMYNYPFLSDPRRVASEAKEWRDRTDLYDDFYKNESSKSHDLVFSSILSLIEGRVTSANSIFDVGCNSGYYLQSFYEKGFKNLYGLDPQVSAIDYIKKNRKYVKAEAGFFGPSENDVQADLIIFVNSYDRIPYSARLFEAIDRCANKFVIISTREYGESYKRDIHLEMGLKGFICLEKQTLSYSNSGESKSGGIDEDFKTLRSVFLFCRLPSSEP